MRRQRWKVGGWFNSLVKGVGGSSERDQWSKWPVPLEGILEKSSRKEGQREVRSKRSQWQRGYVLIGEVTRAPAISWLTAHPVSLLHRVGILLLSFLPLRCMSVRVWRYVLAGLESNWPPAIDREVTKIISEILLKIGGEAFEVYWNSKVIC